MATQVLTITTPAALSSNALVALKKEVQRQLKRTSGANEDGSSIAVTTVPTDAPDTVAGTNGVLSSVITWVKSTDTSVTHQILRVRNGALTVLYTAYLAPDVETLTPTLTAVAQTATVAAVNPQGETVSAASAAFTPTAS